MSLFAELWDDVAESVRPARLYGAGRDPLTAMAFGVGFIGLAFSPGEAPPLWRMLLAAMTEELTFRVLLQSQAERLFPGAVLTFGGHARFFKAQKENIPGKSLRGPDSLSRGGLLVSALFACSHLVQQPPLMALLTFFPSLAFAVLWTRHRSFWLCSSLHLWYNWLFFF